MSRFISSILNAITPYIVLYYFHYYTTRQWHVVYFNPRFFILLPTFFIKEKHGTINYSCQFNYMKQSTCFEIIKKIIIAKFELISIDKKHFYICICWIIYIIPLKEFFFFTQLYIYIQYIILEFPIEWF